MAAGAIGENAVVEGDIPPGGRIVTVGALPGRVVGRDRVATGAIGKAVLESGFPVPGTVAVSALSLPMARRGGMTGGTVAGLIVVECGRQPAYCVVAVGALIWIMMILRRLLKVTSAAVGETGVVKDGAFPPFGDVTVGALTAIVIDRGVAGVATGAIRRDNAVLKDDLGPIVGAVAVQARVIIVIGQLAIPGAALIRKQKGVTQARPEQPVRVVANGADAGILDGRNFPLMAKAAHGDGEISMIKRDHAPARFVIVTGDAGAGVVIRRLVPLVA